MKIAILALQGAFAEHEQMLRLLGVETTLIREHWEDASGLIIPGGESTSMMRIMRDEGLFEPIRQAILDGLPVLGTCAGLIMLDRNHLGVMDILAKRMRVCREIGHYKKEHNMTVLQASRYNEILSKRGVQGSLCGMAPDFVAKVFENIHEESVRQQIEIINK